MNSLTTLFINHYTPAQAVRKNELDVCFRKNCDCAAIDRIVALAQSTPAHRKELDHPKVTWVDVEKRPTYQTFFQEINARTTSPYDINLFGNSDLYYDDSLNELKAVDLEGVCLALARWDVQPDGSSVCRTCNNGQDTWVFQGRVRPVGGGDFNLGIFGCDNRIAWDLRHADYRVLNPAFTIKSHTSTTAGFGTTGGTSATPVSSSNPPPWTIATWSRRRSPRWA